MDDERPTSKSSKKRAHSEETNLGQDGEKEHQRPRRNLMDLSSLPIELLYSIHLYAKNPSLVLINRRFHSIFSTCPTSIKAKFLLARWYEAYCYGFHPAAKAKSITSRSTPHTSKNKKGVPSTPTKDLLENGSLPELSWSSRFLPVLPTKDFPYPLSNSFQRSADHYILDFCLQYPLCNSDVLSAVEDIVLSKPEFGNIALATGLWRDDQGQLCTHQGFFEDERDHDQLIRPDHLTVNQLPKRIFQKLEPQEDSGVQGSRNPFEDAPILPEAYRSSASTSFNAELAQHLKVFGEGAFPNPSLLLLFLNVISLHVPTSPSFISASIPINGYEGLALVKSAFARSLSMVQLLLSLGAEPSRKEGLALYVAIRKGWLEGFQAMIERDEAKISQWDDALRGIRKWFQRWNEQRRQAGVEIDQNSSDDPGRNGDRAFEQLKSDRHLGMKKRRRLSDRAQPDSKMLKEAVKHNQWAIANYIRSKGVIPDLRTIKLIELKQPDELVSKGGTGPQTVR